MCTTTVQVDVHNFIPTTVMHIVSAETRMQILEAQRCQFFLNLMCKTPWRIAKTYCVHITTFTRSFDMGNWTLALTREVNLRNTTIQNFRRGNQRIRFEFDRDQPEREVYRV